MPHIHKEIDLVASVYIVYSNRVLLVLHKKLNNWVPPGGHVELNEDAEQALMREIGEETGLDVKILSAPIPEVPGATDIKFLPVPTYFDIHKFNEEHRHMNLVYFGISTSNKAVLAPREHHELRWFTSKEIDDPKWKLWPSIRFYAKEALQHAQAHKA